MRKTGLRRIRSGGGNDALGGPRRLEVHLRFDNAVEVPAEIGEVDEQHHGHNPPHLAPAPPGTGQETERHRRGENEAAAHQVGGEVLPVAAGGSRLGA